MNLKKLKLKVDEVNELNELLQSGTFNGVHIACNGIRIPVPHELLKRWHTDLEDHLKVLKEELKKEMNSA